MWRQGTLDFQMALRLGLIGLGAIGRGVLRLLTPADDVQVVGALVRNASRSAPVPLFDTLDELLARHPDVVVEVAGHKALRCYGARVLRSRVDLIMLSVGALADADVAAKLRESGELFRGCAREGVLKFPENINVAAAVSLAGIGLDRTEVCVIADPALERNMHEVV